MPRYPRLVISGAMNQVVHEACEDARRLGGVEVGDFVAPALASDLFERRFEAAGDELFVEAWNRAGRNLLAFGSMVSLFLSPVPPI